jgi:hypothetical protein
MLLVCSLLAVGIVAAAAAAAAAAGNCAGALQHQQKGAL